MLNHSGKGLSSSGGDEEGSGGGGSSCRRKIDCADGAMGETGDDTAEEAVATDVSSPPAARSPRGLCRLLM